MWCGLQSYLAFIPLNRAYGDIRQKSLTTAETKRDGEGVQLTHWATWGKYKGTGAWVGTVCVSVFMHVCKCPIPCVCVCVCALKSVFESLIWIHDSNLKSHKKAYIWFMLQCVDAVSDKIPCVCEFSFFTSIYSCAGSDRRCRRHGDSRETRPRALTALHASFYA